jgi:hypothetical protein
MRIYNCLSSQSFYHPMMKNNTMIRVHVHHPHPIQQNFHQTSIVKEETGTYIFRGANGVIPLWEFVPKTNGGGRDIRSLPLLPENRVTMTTRYPERM